MAIEFRMPALSPTMEKGTIAKWLVKGGDRIRPGDLIAEIETDKATMEVEAVDAGVVASLVVPEGTDDVAVGTVIALIAGDGEEGAPREPEPADAAPPTAAIVTAPPPAAPPPVAVEAAPAQAAGGEESGVNATPLARRIAKAKGLSLLGIAGSGARGRIVKADLGLTPPIAAPSLAAAAPAPAPVHAPPVGVPVETVRLSGMRRTIARRLTEAKQSVPHFYLTAHCRIDALLALRRDLNDGLVERGVKLSVNDLVMKAMALAMVEVPDTNVQYAGEEMHRFGRVDIAMAVAVEGGLVTPVIADVASLSLSALAIRSRDLAARARDGRLAPEEYQGGTASLSNLGMYGIDEMIPVINPPQALIVGVGAGIEKPWKVDGAIALATIMTCTASFDHRAIDGAAAARFMAALRALIEQPLRIVS